MTDKPEALRLADALEISSNHGMRREAAAELRRLYAERTAADDVINDLVAKVRGLQTQRDALLEALKEAVDICGWPNVAFFHKALAAIKAAEENT